MSDKFEKLICNLQESLENATPHEDGPPSYCMIMADEVELFILMAHATSSPDIEAMIDLFKAVEAYDE